MAIVLEEVFKVYQELTKKSEEDSIYGVRIDLRGQILNFFLDEESVIDIT